MIVWAQQILTGIIDNIKAFLVLSSSHCGVIFFIHQHLNLLQVLQVILRHLFILYLLLNHPFQLHILLNSLILPNDLLNLVYLHQELLLLILLTRLFVDSSGRCLGNGPHHMGRGVWNVQLSGVNHIWVELLGLRFS